MPRRILIFSPFFSPSNHPEAIVTGKLVLAMRDRGWHVDVISAATAVDSVDDSDLWAPLQSNTYTTTSYLERPAKLMVQRVHGILCFGHVISGIGWAQQALSLGLKLCRTNKYDVTMSRSRPVYAHLPAMKLKEKRKIPWIASWNDPPNRDPFPYGLGPKAKVAFADDRAVQRMVAHADCNLFCADRLRQYSGLLYPRLLDAAVIPHVGRQVAVSRSVDPRRFTILHVGSLDGARNPRIFLAGLDQFLQSCTSDQRTKVVLQFIGGHRINSDIQKMATPLVREVIRVAPWCAYEESLRLMSGATVLLMIEAAMEEGYLMLAKLADYAVSPRPILAVSPAVGTAADFFTRYGGGLVADNRDPSAIYAALQRLFSAWQNRKIDREFEKSRIAIPFSADSIIDCYDQLIGRLVEMPQLHNLNANWSPTGAYPQNNVGAY